MPATYDNNESKRWLIAKIRELDSEGLTQREIGQQLQLTQQTISYALQKLREQDRLALENHHKMLASTYRQTLDNLLRIRRSLWEDLKQTTDKRTKASFYHELQEVNLKIMELASSNDIVLATVRNAEKIAAEAKKDLQKARARVVDTSGGAPSEQEVEIVEEVEGYEDIPIGDDDSSSGDSGVVEEAQASVTSATAHDSDVYDDSEEIAQVDSSSGTMGHRGIGV
jgi:DNA-binding transcriptional regulator LsrR (DeoR family)